jgi:tRNA dimethylallyltransferase
VDFGLDKMTYLLPSLVILGPTACGKTKLAVAVAKAIAAEIVSADSRQVYTGMNIGTGKDLFEYANVLYHLIDILPAGAQYNVQLFLDDFQKTASDIAKRGNKILLCGGTGLYIQAVLEQYNYTQIPQNEVLRRRLAALDYEQLLATYNNNTTSSFTAIAKIESQKRLIRAIEINEYLVQNPSAFWPSKQPKKLPIIGLYLEAAPRRNRIDIRLQQRLEIGLLEEVKGLLDQGIPAEKLKYYGLEYKFCAEYLEGKYDYTKFVYLLQTAIHQYAKRQMTYWRKMERNGHEIFWIDATTSLEKQVESVLTFLDIFFEKRPKFG